MIEEERSEEIEKITSALQEFIGREYEVHLFDREKQEFREKTLEKKLPNHDFSQNIKKSNAWIVWLTDENHVITDLQVYDFQRESGPYKQKKIVEYVDFHMKKTAYRDCGCVTSDWNEWRLIDVYFKLGWQYGFYSGKVMERCLRRLSNIDEILGHLKFLQ